MTTVSAHEGVGAYKVIIQKDKISSVAKCSCGKGTYEYRKGTFLNYCPNCNKKGYLNFEEGSSTWTSPEGMWYCTRCDMDRIKRHNSYSQISAPSVVKATIVGVTGW